MGYLGKFAGGIALVGLLSAGNLLAQQAGQAPAGTTTAVVASQGRSMLGRGYLPAGTVPDSLLLNPLPPAPGSAALARDEEAARAALPLRGTPRWAQARIDADIFTATATDVMSCAAGLPIGAETTPRLNALLRKAGPNFAMAVYPTKQKYQRPRPFTVNNQPTCTPEMDAMIRKDGSYPSGHSAIGYGWGLILAELMPERAAQLVARGRSFGDSRRICNVHWLSDVEEGRVVATAVFARLHAEQAFRDDIDAARAEVAALRAKAPSLDCTRETSALAGG